VSRELNALLKNYLKDMRINVQARLDGNVDRNSSKAATSQRYGRAVDSTMEKSKGVLSITQKTLDASTNMSDKKQQQRQQENTPSNNTVKWEFADLGNEKEPIYFVPPNIIYCNTSNDLYKFAMEKNRHYGPTWIRMLPYLARIAVAMSSESASRLTREHLNIRVDEATRYFLRQKKVI
jgi:hypothetical protein